MPNIIVIIDDDPDFAELAKRRLLRRIRDIEIETFTQAGAGFERLLTADKQTPTLVLCDLGLPDVSGYQLVSDIRRNEATKKLPIIVVSARTGLQDHARADEVGADGFVEKPLQGRILETTVQKMIDRYATA